MTRSTMAAQASWLAATTVASYIVGLLRDRLLAAHFGAGIELDVYNSAFLIPDTIMNIFAAALTTAFIPVFTSYRQQHGLAAAWRVTNVILSCLAAVMLVVVLAAYVMMPWLTQAVAPGFDTTAKQLLIHTSRIMLLSPLAFSLSIAVGGALQGTHRFFSYALSPVLYNLGIIVGIIALAPRFGVLGVAGGVVLGAGAHFFIRYIELRTTGWRWQWLFEWRNVALLKTVRLMLPRIGGLLVVQGNLWLYNALASTLLAGSIAVFNLARNFQSLPVSLFGIALATVVFPKLSEHFASTDHAKIVELAERAVRQLLYFTIPAAAGMVVVANPLVATVLGSGKFDATAVQATGITLAVFALSIPIESVQHILARVFYAQQNTVTPVRIAMVGLMVNTIVCLGTIRFIGVIGLVCGFTLTALAQVILLQVALTRRGQSILRGQTILYAAKISGLSLVMMVLAWLASHVFAPVWLQCVVAAGVGIISYGAITAWLRLPEFHATVTLLKNIWKKVQRIISGAASLRSRSL